MKAGMHRSWIDKMTQSELFNPSQSLKPGVIDQFHQDALRDHDKPINGIIKYLDV